MKNLVLFICLFTFAACQKSQDENHSSKKEHHQACNKENCTKENCTMENCDKESCDMENCTMANCPHHAKKKLRHVVLFSFKKTASEADVAKVVAAFEKLPEQIKEIKGFEYGTNNSPEGLNQGLTHCFLLTFNSEADRDAYLPHPAHKAFGEVLTPYLDQVTVVDYWAK